MPRHAAVAALIAFVAAWTTEAAQGGAREGYLSPELDRDLDEARERETQGMMTEDGMPVEGARAFSVALRKSEVDSQHRASFLSSLKQHWSMMRGGEAAFIEEVPLKEQVLNEKRLATYFGEVNIGNQPFKVLFDTGSCEFWIPSVHCSEYTTPAERCERHDKFNPSVSHDYRPFRSHQKMSIQYLSGKVEGGLAQDTIDLGPLKVKDQVFGTADEVDVPLLDEVVWDGIIGLAYPNRRLADAGVKPLFDNIMDHHLLQNNVFSYYLGYNGGAVTFGGVDEKYIANDDAPSFRGNHAFSHHQDSAVSLLQTAEASHPFVYAKVVEQAYWTVEIMDIELQYGDDEAESTGVCNNQPGGRCRAIVDTGTYLIYGPRADVTGALGDIEMSQCKDIKHMPKITFVLFAGDDVEPARLTLHPHDYVLEFHLPTEDGVDCNDDKNRADTARCRADCVIGIGPDNDSGWTLGQVFLRSFYSVFDRDTDRIGFVRSNPNAV